MARKLRTGEKAPNFDLSSTEGAVLMLCDEVPRSPVLLVFLGSPGSAADPLRRVRARRAELTRLGVKVLAVSESKMEELEKARLSLDLPFPLLHDDRGFSRHYGFDQPAKDSGAVMLVLVDRDQRVLSCTSEPADFDAALSDSVALARSLPSSTENYPRSVINRLVDRWVN